MFWLRKSGPRALAALFLMAIGYCAVSRSLAVVLAKADPMLALTFSRGDARVEGRASKVLIDQAKTDAERRRAGSLAQAALLRDSTVVPAAVTLGTYSAFLGNEKASDDWFKYSQELSRRDLQTQLYFIERSVSAVSIDQALRHYDIALRTSFGTAGPTLLPILRSSVAEPAIREALVRVLAKKPSWSSGFLADLAANGPDFVAATKLFIEVRHLGVPITPEAEGTLFGNLIAHGNIAAAWQYYIASNPGASKAIIRNANFDPFGAISSPFDWQLSSDDGVTAILERSGNSGVLSYKLSATVGATVARQMIFLSAGRYRLESGLVASSQILGSGPYWQLTCVDGRLIGKIEMGGPIESPRHFSADLIVPMNCPTQTLSLVVRPSDDLDGASGQIDSISVARISQ